MCLTRHLFLFGVLVLPSVDLQFAVSPLDPEPFPSAHLQGATQHYLD
jgi:hypothetical protein